MQIMWKIRLSRAMVHEEELKYKALQSKQQKR
jgi:hypothetical protein